MITFEGAGAQEVSLQVIAKLFKIILGLPWRAGIDKAGRLKQNGIKRRKLPAGPIIIIFS